MIMAASPPLVSSISKSFSSRSKRKFLPRDEFLPSQLRHKTHQRDNHELSRRIQATNPGNCVKPRLPDTYNAGAMQLATACCGINPKSCRRSHQIKRPQTMVAHLCLPQVLVD